MLCLVVQAQAEAPGPSFALRLLQRQAQVAHPCAAALAHKRRRHARSGSALSRSRAHSSRVPAGTCGWHSEDWRMAPDHRHALGWSRSPASGRQCTRGSRGCAHNQSSKIQAKAQARRASQSQSNYKATVRPVTSRVLKVSRRVADPATFWVRSPDAVP